VCSAVCAGGRRWLEKEIEGREQHGEERRGMVNATRDTRETEVVGEGRKSA